MTPLVTLVIDDETPALDELCFLLAQDPLVGEVLRSDSAAEGLRILQETDVDLALLDIQMPGLTGLDLARVLKKFRTPPAIVFVTAYEQHAVEAFDLQAVDYVLKPIRPARLHEAVRRAADALESAKAAAEDATPAADATTGEHAPVQRVQIPVELAGVTRFVDRDDITHVQAQGDYARLHTDRESHLIRTSLATLEEEWADAGFVRIHRSMLVALNHVTAVRVESGRCSVLVGPHELAVSRRHTRALRDRLTRPSQR